MVEQSKKEAESKTAEMDEAIALASAEAAAAKAQQAEVLQIQSCVIECLRHGPAPCTPQVLVDPGAQPHAGQ